MWHILLGQECVGLTDELNQRFHLHEWQGLTVAFNKDTFNGDTQFIPIQYQHGPCQRTVVLIGIAQLRRPIGGLTNFTAASVHLHHDPAKSNTKALRTLRDIRRDLEQWDVSIVGADLNGACYNGPVEEIFHEFHTPEVPHRALWGPSALPLDQQD